MIRDSRLCDVILMKLVYLIIFPADHYIQAVYKCFSLPTISVVLRNNQYKPRRGGSLQQKLQLRKL